MEGYREETNDTSLVSIIIPTYSRSDMLWDCVNSCLASDYRIIEVIVVDNASSDDTYTRIKQLADADPRVKLIGLKENRMAAGGRNAGIHVAEGEYICFLDNDNLIAEDMISQLVKVFCDHPDAGFVAPLSLNKNKYIWSLGASYNFWTSRPVNLHEHRDISEVTFTKPLYPTCLAQNCSMVKRDIIDQIGGFDENLYAMYEEADFGYRIHDTTRCKMYFCPAATTNHLGYTDIREQPTLRKLGIETPERAFHFAKNRSIFMSRYAPWYCKPLFFGVFIHLFGLAYAVIALRCGRGDIAKAWLKGTYHGIRIRRQPVSV